MKEQIRGSAESHFPELVSNEQDETSGGRAWHPRPIYSKVSHAAAWVVLQRFFAYLLLTSFPENNLFRPCLLDTMEKKLSNRRTSFWICVSINGLLWLQAQANS